MKKLFIAALLVVGMTSFAQERKGRPERSEMEQLTPEQRNQLHLKKNDFRIGSECFTTERNE